MERQPDNSPPVFDRQCPFNEVGFSVIGNGAIGGKAAGLWQSCRILASRFPADRFPGVTIKVPPLIVLSTQVFDEFLQANQLTDINWDELTDEKIAYLFQQGEMPIGFTGDLQMVTRGQHTPLAIRSSSLLEDAIYEPFAGVYQTKMIPNNQFDQGIRFKKLVEGIKFVWASTFFADARRYIRNTSHDPREERMAVIIQEVVGRRHHLRFYPELSGVVRSYNYYPTGHAKPEQGVVQLALGLGRTIVDGGKTWTYSPAFPRSGPPFGSARDQLRSTQVEFWAVNMGEPAQFNPLAETEYLVKGDLTEAEDDGSLPNLVSTYDGQGDQIRIGMGNPGPRVLDFAPLLQLEKVPINPIVKALLADFAEELGEPVEIEFAATMPSHDQPEAGFGFLQVRPLVVSARTIEVAPEEMVTPQVVVASEKVLGNGELTTLEDIIYVRPETFSPKDSRLIGQEIAQLNDALAATGRCCLLIGFGRWGSSDPWLGVPVTWGQIGRARTIVEATTPEMNVDLSQGSHFFHNMTSFQVYYFSVPHTGKYPIDWAWLAQHEAVKETTHARWIHLAQPLKVRVDGRGGFGCVCRGSNE